MTTITMSRVAATRRKIKEEEVSSLKTLYDILHNRIIQKKRKCIGPIIEHKRTTYRERYIEILHWMLAHILTLKIIYSSRSTATAGMNKKVKVRLSR